MYLRSAFGDAPGHGLSFSFQTWREICKIFSPQVSHESLFLPIKSTQTIYFKSASKKTRTKIFLFWIKFLNSFPKLLSYYHPVPSDDCVNSPSFFFFLLDPNPLFPYPVFHPTITPPFYMVTLPRSPKIPFVTAFSVSLHQWDVIPRASLLSCWTSPANLKVFQIPSPRTCSSLVPPITTSPIVAVCTTWTELLDHTSKLDLVKDLVQGFKELIWQTQLRAGLQKQWEERDWSGAATSHGGRWEPTAGGGKKTVEISSTLRRKH